jgi:hypothetical protein
MNTFVSFKSDVYLILEKSAGCLLALFEDGPSFIPDALLSLTGRLSKKSWSKDRLISPQLGVYL